MFTVNENVCLGLCGWLSPNGKFIQCDYEKHNEYASKIINANPVLKYNRDLIRDIYGGRLSDDYYLGVMGFIKMSSPTIKHPYAQSVVMFPEMWDMCNRKSATTELQKQWIEKNIHRLNDFQKEFTMDFLSVLVS